MNELESDSAKRPPAFGTSGAGQPDVLKEEASGQPDGRLAPQAGEDVPDGESDDPDLGAQDHRNLRQFLSSLWTITIVGGVVAAVAGPLVLAKITGNSAPAAAPASGVSQSPHVSSVPHSPESATSPRSSRPPQRTGRNPAAVPATAANSPARVEGVTPLKTVGASLAVANKLELTGRQLAQLNAFARGNNSTTLRFLSSNHAVPVSDPGAFTDVTVMGNESKIVTITGMQVVKHCQAPLTGALFYNPSQGFDSTIRLSFNLDGPIDYAQYKSGPIFLGNVFQEHVVTLQPGETHTFSIYVETALHYCQFTFQMTVATPNGVVAESIDDNGKPFQLTSQAPQFSAYQAIYAGGVESPEPNGSYVQVNPKTYRGY